MKVRVTGLSTIQRTLKITGQNIKNTRIANKAVALQLDRWVEDNFATEGGKVGKWAPFKLGGRRMKGGGIDTSAKLLRDTLALRGSFRGFSDNKMAGIGFHEPYGLHHEFGLPGRNLPARRMLPNNKDQDVKEMARKIYELHIEKAISK